MPSKLYVGNLAYSVTNADLEQLFSQAGQVQSAAVIMDKFSGQSKGFGFVEMANADEASKAIAQFNESELKGRNIKVNEAKPRESSFGGRQSRWWRRRRPRPQPLVAGKWGGLGPALFHFCRAGQVNEIAGDSDPPCSCLLGRATRRHHLKSRQLVPLPVAGCRATRQNFEVPDLDRRMKSPLGVSTPPPTHITVDTVRPCDRKRSFRFAA